MAYGAAGATAESDLHHLTAQEEIELEHLRQLDPEHAAGAAGQPPLTWGERVADRLAAEVGSWRFLVIQTIFFMVWIVANIVGWVATWDPYPFILLNLILSFQAAYTAPVIMMSQNRQAEIDRNRAISDYSINLKAALEIKLLHQKIDALTAILEEMQKERCPAGAPHPERADGLRLTKIAGEGGSAPD